MDLGASLAAEAPGQDVLFREQGSERRPFAEESPLGRADQEPAEPGMGRDAEQLSPEWRDRAFFGSEAPSMARSRPAAARESRFGT